jgi:hypothetical protein
MRPRLRAVNDNHPSLEATLRQSFTRSRRPCVCVHMLQQGVQGGAAAAAAVAVAAAVSQRTCVGVRPGVAVWDDVKVYVVYQLAFEHWLQLHECEVGTVPVPSTRAQKGVSGDCQGGRDAPAHDAAAL